MTLTIQHDNGNTYVWRSGDDKAELQHAINLLQAALNAANEPLSEATNFQVPLPPPPKM